VGVQRCEVRFGSVRQARTTFNAAMALWEHWGICFTRGGMLAVFDESVVYY